MMKIVETKLYRYEELAPVYKERAWIEYHDSFISKISEIKEVWFTWTGLVYPIFNT